MKRRAFFRIRNVIIILILSLQSCLKDSINEDVDKKDAEKDEFGMVDMKVSDEFSWKTVQAVKVEILPNANAVYLIKSEKGDVYHKEYVESGKVHQVEVTLPAYVTKVVVELAGQQRKATISEGSIKVAFD